MSNIEFPTTGYKAAKHVVNPRLEAEGLKTVPPQMIYTYIKKGYIDSVEVNGQALVTEEAVTEWLNGYVAKKLGQNEEAEDTELVEA